MHACLKGHPQTFMQGAECYSWDSGLLQPLPLTAVLIMSLLHKTSASLVCPPCLHAHAAMEVTSVLPVHQAPTLPQTRSALSRDSTSLGRAVAKRQMNQSVATMVMSQCMASILACTLGSLAATSSCTARPCKIQSYKQVVMNTHLQHPSGCAEGQHVKSFGCLQMRVGQ